MGEAYQCVHERQLARMIKLESRNAFAVGSYGRCGQLLELTAVDKGLQNIFLDIKIVVSD
jgi:hypothetical protein